MKRIAPVFFALIFSLVLLSGCDKGDRKIKKLNHGDGTWTIESIHYEYYDTLGHAVVSDSTVSDPGELVFFKSSTLDALFDYYLVVADMKNADGTISAYRGEVYFDESRADFDKTASLDPFPFFGVWSVNDSSRHKQEWSAFTLRSDGSLYSKTTLSLKKK